jgi:drug/metabolite transporter (DMT)-like permease
MDPAFVRTVLLILVAVVGATVGDTLLSVGMRRIGELTQSDARSIVAYFWRAFTSPYVMGGIGCLAIYFFTWLVVLSEADLSLALPMTALTFVLGAFLARFWLGETVSLMRWLGTAIIAVGVIIVATTGTHQTSSVPPAPPAESGTPAP